MVDNLSGGASVHESAYDIGKVLWLTGLSGAGKSTIAGELAKTLIKESMHVIILDGDNIRKGLCKDLGFSQEDRSENVRRIAEVCKLFSDVGVTVISSFISPTISCREMAREIIGEPFREVFVSCPLEVCEKRDVKGLYKKARAGEIKDFTGISSAYDIPENPDIIVETNIDDVKSCVDTIMGEYKKQIYEIDKPANSKFWYNNTIELYSDAYLKSIEEGS